MSEHYVQQKYLDVLQDDFVKDVLDELDYSMTLAANSEIAAVAVVAQHSNQRVFHSGQFERLVGNHACYCHNPVDEAENDEQNWMPKVSFA